MELIDPVKSSDNKKSILGINTAKANVIFDIVYDLTKAQALLVAHNLDLFSIIDKNKSISLEDISTSLAIQTRPAQALLSMCASLELVALNAQHKFELTETAKDFLLKESPFYIGGALDITLMNGEIYSFNNFKHAILNNASQVYQGKELFQTNEEQEELGRTFTHGMHCKSMVMANQWPQKIDLSLYQTFLDIGGGSGAHSITPLLKWNHLHAIVYDRPAVCEVAQRYINNHGLGQRIQTQVGDMWQDDFPPADVHFYSDIFHDWSMDKCQFLIQKSYDFLKPGGRIIIHEMLFDDNKTGPSDVAAYNIMMLLWTQGGQQYSGKELVTLLENTGFIEVQILTTGFGSWNLITALKD